MGKKLNLKIPEIKESQTDIFLICLGVFVIGYALYLGGAFNGPGKVIDASDRFGKSSKDIGNGKSEPEGTNQ